MGEGCKDVGLLGVTKEETSRVKLTEVNPHLVCVLCHGYFVDATTITECLHSFCRSCIFRHLETKSFCPICEVQVHARLHRSLKPDKTLQDIVYKLVPGLFHNEMERRRVFYKQHPYRDEHLEPERRGLGLDRLIYSPTDTISLSLEFYDTEREREEWSSVTCPPPHSQEVPNSVSANNNNNKRYLQCPAIFKMAHLKKFLRQKYNLPPNANVEIIYKREFLPDSYSLMDVAYIYTWKRNGPMRFYYRIPDVVENEMFIEGKPPNEKLEEKINSLPVSSDTPTSSSPASDLERNKKVLSAANLPVETEEKKLPLNSLNFVENNHFNKNLDIKLDGKLSKNNAPSRKEIPLNQIHANHESLKILGEDSSEKSVEKKGVNVGSLKDSNNSVPENTLDKNIVKNGKEETNIKPNLPKLTEPVSSKENDKVVSQASLKVSKQDELPVEVLLSLSTCRVAKDGSPAPIPQVQLPISAPLNKEPICAPNTDKLSVQNKSSITIPKAKNSSNARMSLTKIANELQQRAANSFIQKNNKESNKDSSSPTKNSNSGKMSPSSKLQSSKNGSSINNVNGRTSGNKRKNNGSVTHSRHFFNDISVMDQRIQQLYKNSGSPTSNSVVPVGQKTESRLANWLNNRFQAKPPGSPVHPGVNSSLSAALSNQIPLNSKMNGAKSLECIAAAGINISLQNAVNASIKASPQHQSTQPASPHVQKNLIENNHLPGVNTSNLLMENGIKSSGEKREKSKSSQLTPNEINILKKLNICKDLPPNPSLNTSKLNNNTFSPVSSKSSTSSSPKPSVPVIPPKILPTKTEDISKNEKQPDNVMNGQLAASYVKDQGLVISEQQPVSVSSTEKTELPLNSPRATVSAGNQSPNIILSPCKEEKHLLENNKNAVPATNGVESKTAKDQKVDSSKKSLDVKGDPSKLDAEVNRLKRKLEEMRKVSNIKGKELGGCRITHENPDPEEAKRRRDLTPVVSIELMRGCKRPVPGLKAIQDMVDLGKRKAQDDKKEHSEKKLKIPTIKKDVSKKEETCALDLSRCGPPKPNTPPHPWFNPLLHQQFLPSPK